MSKFPARFAEQEQGLSLQGTSSGLLVVTWLPGTWVANQLVKGARGRVRTEPPSFPWSFFLQGDRGSDGPVGLPGLKASTGAGRGTVRGRAVLRSALCVRKNGPCVRFLPAGFCF